MTKTSIIELSKAYLKAMDDDNACIIARKNKIWEFKVIKISDPIPLGGWVKTKEVKKWNLKNRLKKERNSYLSGENILFMVDFLIEKGVVYELEKEFRKSYERGEVK